MDINRGHFAACRCVAADRRRQQRAAASRRCAARIATLNELEPRSRSRPAPQRRRRRPGQGVGHATIRRRSLGRSRPGRRRPPRRARDARRPGEGRRRRSQALEEAKARLDFLRGPGREVERARRRPGGRPVERRQPSLPWRVPADLQDDGRAHRGAHQGHRVGRARPLHADRGRRRGHATPSSTSSRAATRSAPRSSSCCATSTSARRRTSPIGGEVRRRRDLAEQGPRPRTLDRQEGVQHDDHRPPAAPRAASTCSACWARSCPPPQAC